MSKARRHSIVLAQRVVAALALSLTVSACVDSESGSITPKSPVKIMSYNIRHGLGMDKKVDVARVAAVIKSDSPDFVGLQEVDKCTTRVGGMDEPAELARLTGLHATFAEMFPYKGGRYGIALLSREKPISVKQMTLPGKEPHVFLLCEFESCWVGTTHLFVGAEKYRLESIAKIKPIVNEAAQKKPVFLTGDWNATPTSRTLKDMEEFMTLVSTTNCLSFHGVPIKGPDGKPCNCCIDYVAVDSAHAQAIAVTDTYVIEDRMASDHAPIVATLREKGQCL